VALLKQQQRRITVKKLLGQMAQYAEGLLASPAGAALLLLMGGPKAVVYAQLVLIEVRIVEKKLKGGA
jgi:hypothetical protein